MPLTLVTGPANAAKAGEVLGGLSARLDDEPILVVPAFQDVEHSQRELAESGAVFGVAVLRFDWLFRELARRAGHVERVASDVQRELVVEEAIRRARLELLAESASQPGFVHAAARFVAELGRSMVEPARFTQALRAWAGDGPRRRYAEEVAAIYRGYREGLDAAGLADRELFAWRALDALRAEPGRWGGTPVFVYGFDDFDALQLDALETIAGRCGADVVASLPYEPGRAAFKAVATAHQELLARGAQERTLPPLDDHYAPESRAALHHVERSLFEDEVVEAVEPGGAIELHSAGGQRAEVELVGARLLRLLRAGVEPGDIAVVLRRPGAYASLLEQVFGAYEIPFSIDRSVPLGHTGLGRGLLALVRCAALPDATAADLLAWLRTPGLLREPGLADRLEARVRRDGAHSAAEARAIWESEHWKLDALDRLREAGPGFLAELERQLGRLFAGPYHRRAAILRGPELDDPRVYGAARQALSELRAVADADPRTRLGPERVLSALGELRVRLGEPPQPDRVQVAEPEAIRARRFQAVFVCGLQEGEFPSGSLPEPFLPDEDRRAIAAASGLRLPVREDRLDRERYLFYVCCSRAERLLVLSSRTSDEEGNPQQPSFFVEDVRDLLAERIERVTRSLSDVTWAVDDAPTAAELERAQAAGGPRRPQPSPDELTAAPLLELLGAREAVSAGALENFADCPVKWLVKNVLAPTELVPDPEQMVRGRYAHSVLQRTFQRLREDTGDRAVAPANLAHAKRLLIEELHGQRAQFQMSPKQTRVRAAARRLEFDLLSFLDREAARDGSFQPEHLELAFGYGEHGEPVEIAPGVRVGGRIDRVDTSDGMALVIDYKGGKRVDSYKASSWESENRFQAALYMLVVERLLGLRAAGGVYVPLGSSDPPRGMVAQDVEELGSGFTRTDVLAPEEFRSKLEWALEQVSVTAGRMRSGQLGCDPDQCAWDGGCSYPSICRCEG